MDTVKIKLKNILNDDFKEKAFKLKSKYKSKTILFYFLFFNKKFLLLFFNKNE